MKYYRIRQLSNDGYCPQYRHRWSPFWNNFRAAHSGLDGYVFSDVVKPTIDAAKGYIDSVRVANIDTRNPKGNPRTVAAIDDHTNQWRFF